MNNIRMNQTQYRTLSRFPRHAGTWRALNVRLSAGTQVVVGSQSVRLVRGSSNGSAS
jgi:hypothetical protein